MLDISKLARLSTKATNKLVNAWGDLQRNGTDRQIKSFKHFLLKAKPSLKKLLKSKLMKKL